MKGLIDIEAVNKKVDEIEAAKNLLDAGKPFTPRNIYVSGENVGCSTALRIECDKSGKISNFLIGFNGCNWSGGRTPDQLKEIAACIVKAFGPIPQELIDSVVVE